jgi:hypothetical protein
MFPQNKKMELLLACLYAGWRPHRRTSRLRELIALVKGKTLVEFQPLVAQFFRLSSKPGGKYQFERQFRLPYRKVAFDLADAPRSLILVNIPPNRQTFLLKEPWKGLLAPEPQKPDMPYLRQFVDTIRALTIQMGQAPFRRAIINDLHYGTGGALTKYRIRVTLAQGEGILWRSVKEVDKQHQPWRYYLLPGQNP